jgi:hypothetical protein
MIGYIPIIRFFLTVFFFLEKREGIKSWSPEVGSVLL